ACVGAVGKLFADEIPTHITFPSVAALSIVAVTAGLGMWFRGDLCFYLAVTTDILFLFGSILLVGQMMSEFARPLPLPQYNTDDAPTVEAFGRLIGALYSLAILAMSAFSMYLA